MNEETISTRTVFHGRIFDVDRVDVRLEDGTTSVRDIVRHSGAVGVVARRPDGRYILVRQFRKAHERELLEIVAGTLDENEDPRVCAERELEEETGHRALSITALGPILPSPGYVDERIELFYAELSAEASGQKLDDDERVVTVALTAEEIEERIASGALRDAKSIAAWFLHLRLVKAGAPS